MPEGDRIENERVDDERNERHTHANADDNPVKHQHSGFNEAHGHPEEGLKVTEPTAAEIAEDANEFEHSHDATVDHGELTHKARRRHG